VPELAVMEPSDSSTQRNEVWVGQLLFESVFYGGSSRLMVKQRTKIR
jgi:hypothetical protein